MIIPNEHIIEKILRINHIERNREVLRTSGRISCDLRGSDRLFNSVYPEQIRKLYKRDPIGDKKNATDFITCTLCDNNEYIIKLSKWKTIETGTHLGDYHEQEDLIGRLTEEEVKMLLTKIKQIDRDIDFVDDQGRSFVEPTPDPFLSMRSKL